MISNVHSNQPYIHKYILDKKKEKEKYFYEPTQKFLTIIACHTSDYFRLQIVKKNINHLNFKNNDIMIINTAGLSLNHLLKKECEKNNFMYFEIENNQWFDFGKWFHVLSHVDYSTYDFIHFTNDSFSIHAPIYHFFNLATKKQVELYAYTSSSEFKYHYQSYLFIVKVDAIQKLMDFLKNKIKLKKGIDAVCLELNLLHIFDSKDCFLDLGKNGCNVNQNIFFTNNEFYYPLFNSQLLPFVKLKRTTHHGKIQHKHKLLLCNSFYCW